MSQDEFNQLLKLITLCNSIISIRIKNNFLFTERHLALLANRIFENNLIHSHDTKSSFHIQDCNTQISSDLQLKIIFNNFKYMENLKIIKSEVDFWSWSLPKGIRYMPLGTDTSALRSSVLERSKMLIDKKQKEEINRIVVVLRNQFEKVEANNNNNNNSSSES
jgi:hypothetical protein